MKLLNIEGDSVLINGDTNLVEKVLCLLTRVNLHTSEVNEHKMVVRTARNELEAFLKKLVCESCRVLYDLLGRFRYVKINTQLFSTCYVDFFEGFFLLGSAVTVPFFVPDG